MSQNSEIKTLLERRIITPVDNYTVLHFHGDDTERFLQSQTSNDLNQLLEKQVQLHAYCNAKGRINSLLRIMRSDSGFYILLPTDLKERICGIMRMYIMRSKVVIDEPDLRPYLLINQPSVEVNAVSLYQIDGLQALELLLLNSEQVESLSSLENHDDSVDYFSLHHIANGIAEIKQNNFDQWIPQFVNLDLTDGISFSKGCYPGQEIIARLRYLGKIKKRMIAAVSSHHAEAGDSVYAFNEKKGVIDSAGKVLNQVEIDSGLYLYQLVINSEFLADFFADTHQLNFAKTSDDATSLERIALPYEITVEYGSKKKN